MSDEWEKRVRELAWSVHDIRYHGGTLAVTIADTLSVAREAFEAGRRAMASELAFVLHMEGDGYRSIAENYEAKGMTDAASFEWDRCRTVRRYANQIESLAKEPGE